MIARLAIAMTALAVAPGPSAFAQDRTMPVRFQPGATAATVKGTVRGQQGITYTFETTAGQTLQLLFTPSNRSCTVNVYAPGAGEAVHIGSVAGNEFGQTATLAGTYRAQVSLMRNAARRNETCRHTLSIEITGRPGGSSAGISDAMLRDRCRAEAAPMYGVSPRRIALAARIALGRGRPSDRRHRRQGPRGPQEAALPLHAGSRLRPRDGDDAGRALRPEPTTPKKKAREGLSPNVLRCHGKFWSEWQDLNLRPLVPNEVLYQAEPHSDQLVAGL